METLTKAVGDVGSSPRVWGQESKRPSDSVKEGIIPTRMGTSVSQLGTLGNYEDHPHAYGDKQYITVPKYEEQGSSPRVWGQDFITFCFALYPGIIPTRMGTSNFQNVKRKMRGDHPHAYGDKYVCYTRS